MLYRLEDLVILWSPPPIMGVPVVSLCLGRRWTRNWWA